MTETQKTILYFGIGLAGLAVFDVFVYWLGGKLLGPVKLVKSAPKPEAR